MRRGPHPYLTTDERVQRKEARRLYSAALRHGMLTRQRCQVCGEGQTHGHHHQGYDQPLNVEWLCPRHHGMAHLDDQQFRFAECYRRALITRSPGLQDRGRLSIIERGVSPTDDEARLIAAALGPSPAS